MISIRTLDGVSFHDIFDPSFRIIDFADESCVVLVSKYLRSAWMTLPPEDTSVNGVLQFIQEIHQRTEDERQTLVNNIDRESIDTPWRQSVYHLWNNVFADVMTFLQVAAPIPRNFHSPSHEVLPIPYPSNSNLMMKKAWQTSVLIIPTYIEANVHLRITYLHEETNEKTLGTFDTSNTTQIWYIRSGVPIHIFVEGNYDQHREGLAALIICGLTSD